MSDDGSRYPTEDFLEWWQSLPRNRPPSANPTVRLRLSASEAGIVRNGLRYIASNYHVLTAGYSPSGYVPWYHQPQPFDPGEFNRSLMTGIVHLHAILNGLFETGGRVRLDAFTAAAAILAVRVALRKIPPAGVQGVSNDAKKYAKQLLSKLEKYRKRAKRAFIARSGCPAYAEAATRWKRFLRWVRVTLLGTGRWPKCAHRRRVFQLMLKEWMEIARSGLQSYGRPVPPNPELKRLIRLALAYCRRGRTGFRPQDILRNHDLGESYLADFIRDRYAPCQVRVSTEDDLAAMFQ
jgi:hypothetical protein